MKQFLHITRTVGSYLGVIEGLTNTVHVPVAVRTVLVAVSGAIMAIEHNAHVNKTPKA
mgnify:CR=1 FL=1